jgi:hypothetical protein
MMAGEWFWGKEKVGTREIGAVRVRFRVGGSGKEEGSHEEHEDTKIQSWGAREI